MRFLAALFLAIGLLLGHSFSSWTRVAAQSTTGKLAFTFGGSGNSTTEIFTINADGTAQTRLTDNGLDDRAPAWSPDGRKLAFESNRNNGTYNVFVMNADGSNAAPLTNDPYPIGNSDPAWSPDGSKIAFVSSRGGPGKIEIWVMNADGSNPTRLTVSEPYNTGTINPVYSTAWEPAWSPDGTKIAFSSRRNGDFNLDIYVMNADGSNQVRLTDHPAQEREPSWSPDGSKITFTSQRDGNHEVYMMNADGTNQRNLTNFSGGNDYQSVWSPFGDKIAFARLTAQFRSVSELYVMNVDGSNQVKITNNPLSESWMPAWQPSSNTPTPTPTPVPIQATVQFGGSIDNYSFNEGTDRVTITITRTGDTSNRVTVDYASVDDPAAVRCDDTVNNQGAAYARCDYATTVGTLTFAPHETQQTFTISLIDDAYLEGKETLQLRLSNPQGGTLGTQSTVTLTIIDNDTTVGAINPILTIPFFVRMQYLDFLSREPEADGFNAWTGVLHRCSDVNNNPNCDRLAVSSSFFRAQEFQLKGYYVYLFYKVALNRRPLYAEIIPDMSAVTGMVPLEVYQKKAAFAAAWLNRREVSDVLGGLSNTAFVETLLARYHTTSITTIDPADPDGTQTVMLSKSELINRLEAQALTRAQVLRAVVQSQEVDRAEYNGAFVAMQYYGYLRRTPDDEGYQAWLRYLNVNPTEFRTMVSGFMNSNEYRLRFGATQ